MKIYVAYWSATGNTEKMATELVRAARDAGAEVSVKEVKNANIDEALKADILALGCPAMDAEVIEFDEMDPFLTDLEKVGIKGKNLILFGSYDWGDGEWMRNWQGRMTAAGANLLCEGIIAQNEPDTADLTFLRDRVKKAIHLCP